MMTTTTPYELATASGAARAAIQTAAHHVGMASGCKIAGRTVDNHALLECIEYQQDAIGALLKMVNELHAEVASLDRVLASRTDGLV